MRLFSAFLFTMSMVIAQAGHAGVIVLSGDTNIIDSIYGTGSAPADPDNATFFNNLLGSGTNVGIYSQGTDSIGKRDILQSYYESIPGANVTRITKVSLADADLDGLDLLIMLTPYRGNVDHFSRVKVADFLNNDGTLFIAGQEHGISEYSDKSNNHINKLLGRYKSNMELTGDSVGSGYTETTGLATHPAFSQYVGGIDQLTYGTSNGILGGSKLAYGENGEPIIAINTNVRTVPEPGTVTMLLSALFAVIVLRKKALIK